MGINFRAAFDDISKRKAMLESTGEKTIWPVLAEAFGCNPEELRSGWRRERTRRREAGIGVLTHIDSAFTPHVSTHKAASSVVSTTHDRALPAGLWHNPEIVYKDLRGKTVLCFGDWHVPFHDLDHIMIALRVAKAFGVTHVVNGGDSTQYDQYIDTKRRGGTRLTDPSDDRAMLRKIEEHILENFEEYIKLPGNHDIRFQKLTGVNDTFAEHVRGYLPAAWETGRVTVSEYDYCVLQFTSSQWMVGHLTDYNRQPGREAAAIAAIKGMNVAAFHDHIQGVEVTSNGRYVGISVGSCILNKEVEALPYTMSALNYKERGMNRFKPIQNGFLILEDGAAILFNDKGAHQLHGGGTFQEWIDSNG